jgi:hypothetical protein
MSKPLSPYEAIKVSAIDSVVNKDDDYVLRYVFRWYSKTFHTPLHQVADIPVVDVLTAYYEELYEKMEVEELKEERMKSSMTPEEWAERLRQEEMEELAFMEAIQSEKRIGNDKKIREDAPQKEDVPQEDLGDGFNMSFEDIPI